jgi:hypothetical protein
MQLRMVSVHVENELRGTVPDHTITAYYFALAGAYDGQTPLGQWKSGDRRILWLRPDHHILRLACDGHDTCTIPMRSGAHLQYRVDSRKSLGYVLVDLLFSRGEGATDSDFAKGIDDGAPVTPIPDAYFVARLRQLAVLEVPVVRAAACRQLSYHGEPCPSNLRNP